MNYYELNEAMMDQNRKFSYDLYEKMKNHIKEETVKLVVSTDLDYRSLFHEEWLLLTDKNLYIIYDSGEKLRIKSYALMDIRNPKMIKYHGVYVIEIELPHSIREIARFTKKYEKKFNKFIEYLTKAINNEVFDIKQELHENEKETIHGDNRCKICGYPLPEGGNNCPNCSKRGGILKRLIKYLEPYKFRVGLVLVTTIIFTMLNLAPPYLQKIMIDDVISNRRFDAIKWVVLAILLVHVFRALFEGLRIYQLGWLGQKITYDLRSQVYSHLQKLGLSYYDKRMTGAIMNRVTGNTQEIQGFIVNGLEQTIIHFFTLIVIASILFVIDWKMALIVLIPTPFIIFGTKMYTERIHKVFHRIWRRRSNMSAVLGGAIPGVKVVKAFTQEDYEIDKFHETLDEYFQEEVRAAKHRSIFFPSISITTSIGAVLIWGYGGYRVIAGNNLTVGELIAFLGYMWRFYQPVQSLSNLSDMFQRATTATERVFEVLDQEPEGKMKENNEKPMKDIKGEISLNHVSFRYSGGDKVLKDINLHINAGEMIGLVGSSGSGKSTLVNLIPRFYEPSEGKILIDGIDIMNMDLRDLRSHIGFVLQEPYLFYGTIAENIAYGKSTATIEEIIWASKTANSHDFIMDLSDGYDTLIGERGVGLSGGQKQRISIARALLKNPQILILDEATSAVDTETEKLIQEALDRLTKNRTTLAIAHRLSTLKNANRIIVMDKGEIVEEGTHDKLMQIENGIFKHLVEIQMEVAQTDFV